MSLEKLVSRLKNSGIISMLLGFSKGLLFSLLMRDNRAQDLWEEVYMRQNTGLHVTDTSH